MGQFVVYLALFLILFSHPNGLEKLNVKAAAPCQEVYQELSSCVSYVSGQDASPSKSCCQGMREITQRYGGTHSDRESVCECFVSLLPLIGSVNGNLVPSLSQKCGLSLTLPPISANFNCSQ